MLKISSKNIKNSSKNGVSREFLGSFSRIAKIAFKDKNAIFVIFWSKNGHSKQKKMQNHFISFKSK